MVQSCLEVATDESLGAAARFGSETRVIVFVGGAAGGLHPDDGVHDGLGNSTDLT